MTFELRSTVGLTPVDFLVTVHPFSGFWYTFYLQKRFFRSNISHIGIFIRSTKYSLTRLSNVSLSFNGLKILFCPMEVLRIVQPRPQGSPAPTTRESSPDHKEVQPQPQGSPAQTTRKTSPDHKGVQPRPQVSPAPTTSEYSPRTQVSPAPTTSESSPDHK